MVLPIKRRELRTNNKVKLQGGKNTIDPTADETTPRCTRGSAPYLAGGGAVH